MTTLFHMPPRLRNSENKVRRVGFEIEYSGLELESSAALILEMFGGQIEKYSNFAFKVKETRHGDYSVESDSAYLKESKYKKTLEKLQIDPLNSTLAKIVEQSITRVADGIVPNEIVSPPIPLTDLGVIDDLRDAMQNAGAQGTASSLAAAFGLHINPELPDLQCETVLSHLRAFLLLYEWVFHESHVNITRRLLPYIQPFPKDFTEHVLDPSYQPTMSNFIDDYMRMTPSRNRPLDLLPLLTHIDRDRVLGKAEEVDLIKPRPTFHYRLPNCCIEDAQWNIATEWNRWVVIERLADQPDRIREMSELYLRTSKAQIFTFARTWRNEVENWLA